MEEYLQGEYRELFVIVSRIKRQIRNNKMKRWLKYKKKIIEWPTKKVDFCEKLIRKIVKKEKKIN